MSQETFVAPSLASLAELLPGYEFEAFIAQGGMGAVYKARQKSLDRDVAIKILPREFGADPEFRESFETEAKAMAKLNHPNLIAVYDFGDVDGMPYIVMELVNGKSLYHSSWNQQIAPGQAAGIVKGICAGLDHAHEHGIVHSDIKPANILLNPNVEPKIGDFGLARPVESDGPTVIMGTPGYTAPEVTQTPDQVDKRVDVFSVGVILYELLSGTPPPTEGPLPAGEVSGDAALDAIWRKATQADPSKRYQSAADMVEALDRWLDGEKSPPGTSTLRTAAGAAAKSSGGAPPGASRQPALAPAAPDSSSSTLGRNIALIIFLLAAIGVTYHLLKQRTAERKAANNELQEPSKAKEPKVEKKEEVASKAPEPMRDPVRARKVEPVPETALESLRRLRAALASGKRDELPLGAISHQQSDFFFVEKEMSWLEGLAFAERHGAQLAVVDDDADVASIMALIPDGGSAWIGAGVSGDAGWSLCDGRRWQLEKAPSGVGTHAAMQSFGAIRARNHTETFGLLLEWRKDGSQTGHWERMIAAIKPTLATDSPTYPPGTLKWADSHYLVVYSEVDRAEASSLAIAAGAKLAAPSTRTEAEWLAEVFAELEMPDGLWLGGTREGPVWVWDNGESWETASWVTGFPEADGGNHLAFHPGQGWKNAGTGEVLDGFIIEWSVREEGSAAPGPGVRKPGQIFTEIEELDKKALELLAREEGKLKTTLKANEKDFHWEFAKWKRTLNNTDELRWAPEIDKVESAIVDGRFPDPEVQFAEVEARRKEVLKAAEDAVRFNSFFDNSPSKPKVPEIYPQEVIDLVSAAWIRQMKIDGDHEKALSVIRDSYLTRLAGSATEAREKGQADLTAAIELKVREAADIESWMSSLSDPGVASAGASDSEPTELMGSWIWNGNEKVIWVLHPGGSCECKEWSVEGSWRIENGTLVVTWKSWDNDLKLEGDRSRLSGTNVRGNEVVLTRSM
ncbi:protein kinase domain-containing protein [Haloferula sp.]|uniref:protein kinase domain-containing protein n=1 Tax=Haloferula sp. TaxID=2497595 RepID=UPI00329F760C